MIHDFETLPHAIGPSATMFWLNDYQKMMQEINGFMTLFGIEVDESYNSVPEFLNTFVFWNETIKWHRNDDGKVNVTAFYFVTGYCNSTSWWDRAEMMLTWREAASRWQQFNVTIYSENSPVFEGIFGLKGTTVQTATITLICMLAVCVLFVPSAAGVLTAGWAICSISLGVFGFLSWWGLDLDPVTMSAIVMSIGFSVDYTAHVSYHYQRARQLLPPLSSKKDRLIYTLDSIGWPMIQAAVSTLVCFLPVAFHPDYTPSVFVRTITLVVGWGLLHGLVLLPAILAAIPDCLFTDLDRRSSMSIPTSNMLTNMKLRVDDETMKILHEETLVRKTRQQYPVWRRETT
uniref:Patched domain-containing protein 3 n=1 Tax=Ascaris suum TaxID=6253 RepID=F1L9I2_ASCSU